MIHQDTIEVTVLLNKTQQNCRLQKLCSEAESKSVSSPRFPCVVQASVRRARAQHVPQIEAPHLVEAQLRHIPGLRGPAPQSCR